VKYILAAVVGLSLVTSSAFAQRISINVGTPVYVASPVYVVPAPVVHYVSVAPAPVYVAAPVHYALPPVMYAPPPVVYAPPIVSFNFGFGRPYYGGQYHHHHGFRHR
jgi:hypothetical protein